MVQSTTAAAHDLDRLAIIFSRPDSIEALESFNELINYRPSTTILETLLELFHRSMVSSSTIELESNPLFIILILKRIITHSNSLGHLNYQPPHLLTQTYQNLIDSIPNSLLLLLSSTTNNHQLIHKNLKICISKLAIRLLLNSNYQFQFDPIHSILIQVDLNNQHPQHSQSLLKIIDQTLNHLQTSNSINSSYLLRQITQNHLENLLLIYNQLISTSSSTSTSTSTSTSIHSIRSLLKIFKIFIQPITQLDQTHPHTILYQLINKLSIDFSNYLLQLQSSDQLSTLIIKTLSNYGQIFLEVQSYHTLPNQLLINYLKLLQLSTHQLYTPTTNNDHHQPSLILIYLHPLLIQALKILNNSINPWSNLSHQSHSTQPNLLESLSPEELTSLISIIQPFLTLDLPSIPTSLDHLELQSASSSSSYQQDHDHDKDEQEDDESEQEDQSSEMDLEEIGSPETIKEDDLHLTIQHDRAQEDPKLPYSEPILNDLNSVDIPLSSYHNLNNQSINPQPTSSNDPPAFEYRHSNWLRSNNCLQNEAQALLSTLKTLTSNPPS